jgi:hypothetical protein
MKELGAIRYTEASSAEFNLNSDAARRGERRFVEETANTRNPNTGALQNPNANQYRPVVRYIGEIDVENTVKNYQNAFTEVYMNIPPEDGSTPLILFKSSSTENVYEASKGYVSATNNPFIEGRNADVNITPPLNFEAFYDHRLNVAQAGLDPIGNPALEFILYPGGVSSSTDVLPSPELNARWFQRGALPGEDDLSPTSGYNIASTGPFAYYTDKLMGDAGNDLIERNWTAPTGIRKEHRYLRSRLDGVQIDFNVDNYKPAQDRKVRNLPELNSIASTGNFEFNAILVYYDVYEADNPTDFETNLYGILFLREPVQSGTFGFKFDCFSKRKASNFQNGNGFSHKLNIRFDTSVENSAVQVAVNDYNTFSMQLFFESASKLSIAADNLQDAITEVANLKNQVNVLKDYVISQNNNIDLLSRIEAIESQISIATNNVANQNSILELIQKLNQEILNIAQGQTSIEISYNLDLISGGEGIIADRSAVNRLIIRNTRQKYDNISPNISLDVVNGRSTVENRINLKPFTNYVRHFNSETLIANDNVYVYINDFDTSWKSGQSFTLNIVTPIEFQGRSIIFLTDAKNTQSNSAPFGVVAAIVSPEITTPTIELVCIDERSLIFDILS